MNDQSIIGAACWHSFVKGWQDACGCKARRPEFSENANAKVSLAYENGYEAGVNDRRASMAFATLEYGYEPTILRAQESANKSLK